MEEQNVPDGTDRGRKRKATGYECMKRSQVIVEEKLEVERKEKDVLFGDFGRTGEGPCKRTD